MTNFRGIFNRTRRIDKTNLPMIEDNFETQGIGFEDAPECLFIIIICGNLNNLYSFTIFSAPKRMTWKIISEQNELDASKVAYSNVKQQIVQDFERIKTEVINKK